MVSFETIIDKSSDELYCDLSGASLIMKKNMLMVLTHVILNWMITFKGQLGKMAKCLRDNEPCITDLAKLFFTDLFMKDNVTYNNLLNSVCTLSSLLLCDPPLTPCACVHPVISHLSVGNHSLLGIASREHRREAVPALLS